MKRYEEIMLNLIEFIHLTGTHEGKAEDCYHWPCDLYLYSADDDLEREVEEWEWTEVGEDGRPKLTP